MDQNFHDAVINSVFAAIAESGLCCREDVLKQQRAVGITSGGGVVMEEASVRRRIVEVSPCHHYSLWTGGLFVGVDLLRVPKNGVDPPVAFDIYDPFTIKTFELSDPNLTDQIIAYLKNKPEGIGDVGPSSLGPRYCPTVKVQVVNSVTAGQFLSAADGQNGPEGAVGQSGQTRRQEKTRQRVRGLYAKRKAAGLCRRCAKPAAPFGLCTTCRQNPTRKTKCRQRKRKMYARRKAAGLCRFCGEPAAPFDACDTCREKTTLRSRSWYQARKASGICKRKGCSRPICGRGAHCAECQEAYRRQRRVRRLAQGHAIRIEEAVQTSERIGLDPEVTRWLANFSLNLVR
jgi:hypothetical protein